MQPRVWFIAIDVPQIEPIVSEFSDEIVETDILNQAIRFCVKTIGIATLMLIRSFHQLRIGPRVCQKMREPRGDGEMVVTPLWLGKKQKVT